MGKRKKDDGVLEEAGQEYGPVYQKWLTAGKMTPGEFAVGMFFDFCCGRVEEGRSPVEFVFPSRGRATRSRPMPF